MMVHLDAFTVEPVFKKGKLGAKVFVHKDEMLPLCYRQSMKDGPDGLHMVFFCITLCGAPGLAVLMKTGTKNLPKQLPRGVKFWWQMIVELGIGTKDDERRLEELAHAGFKVLC